MCVKIHLLTHLWVRTWVIGLFSCPCAHVSMCQNDHVTPGQPSHHHGHALSSLIFLSLFLLLYFPSLSQFSFPPIFSPSHPWLFCGPLICFSYVTFITSLAECTFPEPHQWKGRLLPASVKEVPGATLVDLLEGWECLSLSTVARYRCHRWPSPDEMRSQWP